MTKKQIMDSFRSLAMSNGFYGRLVRHIDEMDEASRDKFLGDLEKKNFKDTVDLILYIEC